MAGIGDELPVLTSIVQAVSVVIVAGLVQLLVAGATIFQHPVIQGFCAVITVVFTGLHASLQQVRFNNGGGMGGLFPPGAQPQVQQHYHVEFWFFGDHVVGPMPRAQWARWRRRVHAMAVARPGLSRLESAYTTPA